MLVRHAYYVYVECITVHMLNVKKIHGEEDDYDTKLKVSSNKSLTYFKDIELFVKTIFMIKAKIM